MSHSSRVLIAEDNPGLARVLQFNLSHIGLDVVVAEDGLQAWNLAQAADFDVVITDHEMPHLSRAELCTKLRELPSYSTTPLVMVTAKVLELNVAQLQAELGLASVFPKPYSPSELVRTVEQLLASAQPGS